MDQHGLACDVEFKIPGREATLTPGVKSVIGYSGANDLRRSRDCEITLVLNEKFSEGRHVIRMARVDHAILDGLSR
jgi:hypothetical protein